jgi:hypothetical protein
MAYRCSLLKMASDCQSARIFEMPPTEIRAGFYEDLAWLRHAWTRRYFE